MRLSLLPLPDLKGGQAFEEVQGKIPRNVPEARRQVQPEENGAREPIGILSDLSLMQNFTRIPGHVAFFAAGCTTTLASNSSVPP